MALIEVPAGERKVLAPLFSDIEYLRGMIESVLNGDLGSAVVNDLEHPEVVQLSVGQNVFLVGNPQSTSARLLVEQLLGNRLLMVSEEWQHLVAEIHSSVRLRRHTGYAFSSGDLDLGYLRRLSRAVPDEVMVQRMDHAAAVKLSCDSYDWGTTTWSLVFKSAAEFIERGIGFCAVVEGELVGVALSGAVGARSIEVDIETKPDFRRKGIATCVGASLLAACLEMGIEPVWSGSNPLSVQLAKKLGYTQGRPYDQITLLDFPPADLNPAPLMAAVYFGKTEVVKSLLDDGHDMNAPGRAGGTPLHHAASLGFVAIVRLLLDHGSELETRAIGNGGTPLFWAVQGYRDGVPLRNQVEVAELLITRGADIHSRDKFDRVVTEYTVPSSDNPMYRLLLNYGATDKV